MDPIKVTEDCSPDQLARLTRREALMSTLAGAFLVLTALVLHHAEGAPHSPTQGRLLSGLFIGLWLAIILEAIAGYWRSGEYSWRSAARLLLIWLLPPFRLSVSTFPPGRCIWLPILGWQRADQACFERLDRAFSIPILLMALMILPILAIEVLWAEYVILYPRLDLLLDLATALIWLAFAVEFVVMSAVAEKKLAYVARHWLNLAIILLPFLAFMRGVQFLRLLRLGKVSKALKIYRLRGLGLRAWQGIVTLELLERALHRSPEARLRHLRGRLREKERELDQLRRRIRALETARDLDGDPGTRRTPAARSTRADARASGTGATPDGHPAGITAEERGRNGAAYCADWPDAFRRARGTAAESEPTAAD